MFKGTKKQKDIGFFSTIKLVMDYLVQDLKRGPLQFKIAVFTIFIIVAFMAILLNAQSITTTMFLAVSETQAGDADFIITRQFTSAPVQVNGEEDGNADFTSMLSFLNISDVSKKLEKVDSIMGVSERWALPGRLINPNDTDLSTSAFAVIGNSLKERSLGIGRALDGYDPLEGNECYVLKRATNVIQLSGEDLKFKVNFVKFLSQNNLEVDNIDTVTDLITGTIPENITFTVETVLDVLQTLANNTLTVDNEFIPPNDIFNASDFNDLTSAVINGTITTLNATNVTLVSYNTENITKILAETIRDLLEFEIDLKVKYFIDSPKGKWPENLGNVVFFDTDFFFDFLRTDIEKKLNAASIRIKDNVTANLAGGELVGANLEDLIEEQLISPILNGYDDMELKKQALTLNAVVKDKPSVYNSFNKFDENLVRISNEMMEALGDTEQYSMTSPLLLGFEFLGYISIFIQGLIYAILIVLAILSYILINSLMVFNIDEKTYEFGMLRALGLRRKSLVYMLFIQGFIFSIAGWTLGVLTSYIASVLIKYIFYMQARVKIGLTMEMFAWIATIFFGFATPVFTNFFSINKSLGHNLKDSLDLYRRSVNQMTIVFIKLAKLGISKTKLLLAFEMTLYGFIFYYVAPLTFYFNRFDIFVMLLNLVFLGMILGLTVMANLLQSLMESLVLLICKAFMCKNRSLKVVIEKNLQSHSNRNRKTALMISMSVCFIIFSGSGIKMNAVGLINQLIATQGGDLALVRFDGQQGLDQNSISNYLEEYKERFPGRIKGYCFATSSIIDYQTVSSVELTPLSLYPRIYATITGVNNTMMDSIHTNLYVPNQYRDDVEYESLEDGTKDGISSIFGGEQTVVEEPYDPKFIVSLNRYRKQKVIKIRNVRAVMPFGFKSETGIDVNTPSLLTVSGLDTTFAKFDITHTANKVPGFGFSGYYNQVAFFHDILISLESYRDIMQDIKDVIDASDNEDAKNRFYSYETDEVKNSEYKLPYSKLILKLSDDIKEKEKDEIKNGIKTFTTDTDFIVDTIDIKRQTEASLNFMIILNSIITILTTLISFFMLLISLMKNVKDNIWELGILRSMGLDHKQIFLIYFVETFSVIFSAFFLGTIVGILVAVSGTVYYVIFFELPFYLYFPIFEFFLLLGSLSLTAILTTWLGLKGVVYQPIAKIMKGLQ